MPANSFKFVSPGIFLHEIDNSQLPKEPTALGPAIITRTEKGPAMRPVQINSFSDFVEVFGNPIAGGQGGDVWRDGNYTAPTYGAYAAQAWLKNASPVTIVRLLGTQHTDATTAGKAGWEVSGSPAITLDSNGGAYGLFIGNNSSSAGEATGNCFDLALAAVFYLEEGSIRLAGTSCKGTYTEGAAVVVQSCGADYEFKVIIEDGSSATPGAGVAQVTSSFNFNEDSAKYIRKVFNTNPTLVNTAITQNESTSYTYGVDSEIPKTNNLKTYWLGQTYDKYLKTIVTGSTSAGGQVAVLLAIKSSVMDGGDYRFGTQAGETGWFISQDVTSNTGSFNPENMTKLFKIVGLESGEWLQRNVKVAITDIQSSTDPANNPYGTFSVELRRANDIDGAVSTLERFSLCNLNPNSANYIAKKIGDMYQVWDSSERRYRVYGNYTNQSRYIRVSMNPDVDAGVTDAGYLPFGFYGPPKFRDTAVVSGTTLHVYQTAPIRGAGDIPMHRGLAGLDEIDSSGMPFKCTFKFPEFPLRVSSSDGGISFAKQAYWGVMASPSNKYEASYVDLAYPLPAGINCFNANSASYGTVPSFVFTLDNLEWTTGSTTQAFYNSGSRANGKSITAGYKYDSSTREPVTYQTASYQNVLDANLNKIIAPIFGGFDGFDITEKEPFRNSQFDGTQTEKNSYTYNTLYRAIDAIADPEVVEFNLACIPGVTATPFTDHLITTCEDRADALAIIDLESGFVPSTENTKGDGHPDNVGTVASTVSSLKARSKNTSYGCCYYPWVQIKDTIAGNLVWVPPSVVALGTMASSERNSELWFAPAGFTRGGLSNGSAGLPVINVRDHLNSSDRDKLYENNINPIAQFPAEGIVIFGQKTLQKTASALDRINVRRLMNYVKKEISRMAATVLFDQNVERTWLRFESKALPFLRSVRARFGLTDFKLILDKTTTTPDLIDRNIMYAKILLKPARSIEFIAIDMVLMNSGAGFND